MRSVRQRILRWLAWRSWEFGRGISIDMDGDVDGSGFLFRLEPPRWLRWWAARHLPSRPKDSFREDISDILVASLLNAPHGLMMPEIRDGTLSMSWTEDALNQ